MRIAAVLFSLYVLSLAVAPVLEVIALPPASVCCRHSCGEETDAPADRAKDDCNELCNPFLSCQCCAGFDLIAGDTFLPVDSSSSNRSETFGRLAASQVVFSIWHPPKVGH